jgi:hypothetical protein
MTPAEFKAIRIELGCTGEAFARALGYGGSVQTLRGVTYVFETGRREIPPTIARLAAMFRDHGIPQSIKGDTLTRLIAMMGAHGIPKRARHA